MAARSYSEEEVREILRRAVEQSSGKSGADGAGLTREELLDTARDAGIDPAAVHEAIVEIERDRDVRAEIAALRKREGKGLASSFVTWAIITAGLLAMRLFGEGGWWFVWPMGVWAVILLLKLKAFMLESPDHARARAERNLEQRRRQRKRKNGHIDHRRMTPNGAPEMQPEPAPLGAKGRSSEAAAGRFRAPEGAEDVESVDGSSDEAAANAQKLRGPGRS